MLTLDHIVPASHPIRGVVVHIALERNADGFLGQAWNHIRGFEQFGAAVIG